MYFPLDTLPSIGFGESSGINQDPFSFIAPCILPFLHISFTERGETFHSKAFSLQVFIYIYQLLSFAILFLILRKLYLSKTQRVKSIRYFAFNYCVYLMFCVLYFSALLFWFFQSTNLFVAYYSDKFNSTEKGPAQLILSLYHIPIVIYSYILLFLLCSQKYGFWANYSILLQVYSYNSIRKCSCSARFT